MSKEIPPKLPRETSPEASGAPSATLEKPDSAAQTPEASRQNPSKASETGKKPGSKKQSSEAQRQPPEGDSEEQEDVAEKQASEKQVETLKPTLSLEKLATAGLRKPPKSQAEIPDFLYDPGTKRNDAAKMIVFEGIDDPKTIVQRTGLTHKTVTTVINAVRKAAVNIMQAQRVQAQTPGAQETQETQVTQERRAGPRGNGVSDTSTAPIDEGEQPVSDSSHRSVESQRGVSAPQRSAADSVKKDSIVMHPYHFPDGRTLYYPTLVRDIEEQESGKLSTSDLLRKQGFQLDPTNPEDMVLEVEGTAHNPRALFLTSCSGLLQWFPT